MLCSPLLPLKLVGLSDFLLHHIYRGSEVKINYLVITYLFLWFMLQIAPTKYRGSLGSLCQIGTCLGIIASLFLAIPSENDPHW